LGTPTDNRAGTVRQTFNEPRRAMEKSISANASSEKSMRRTSDHKPGTNPARSVGSESRQRDTHSRPEGTIRAKQVRAGKHLFPLTLTLTLTSTWTRQRQRQRQRKLSPRGPLARYLDCIHDLAQDVARSRTIELGIGRQQQA